jgi:F0F1-type ATP synthase membrane subunit c/vacuolar-type H+-ATPase subunit K
MKKKLLLVLCAITMAMGNISVSRAEDNSIAAITDVVLVRPGCFVATLMGSVVFVVALPIAAISRSIRSTADTLVIGPAQATFTRPIGDFSTIE